MKKTLAFIVIMILVCLVFSGCAGSGENTVNTGNTENAQDAAPSDKSEEATAEETTAAVGEENKESDTKPAMDLVQMNTDQDDAGNEDDVSGKQPEVRDRKELYLDILYKYKEAQDGKYTMEQVEEMLDTELIQHGWPNGVTGDEVRYLYYDVDGDGEDELIITYYNDIVDIYGYDGEKARIAFSTPYRGIANLYPDGMLCLIFAITAGDYRSTWYQYDTALGDYFAVFEETYDSDQGHQYYTFCYYDLSSGGHKEVEDSYRKTGDYPVWVGEWFDGITEEEYEKLVPKDTEITLPKGEPLSELELPAGYTPRFSAEPQSQVQSETNGQNTGQDNGQKIELSKDEQRRLNLFISNFAEQGMLSFDHDRPNMYEVGRFAYIWSLINHYSDVKVGGDHYYVEYDTVKRVADKYLGLEISMDDLKGYDAPDELHQGFFRNGNYYVPASDGESYPAFAVVDSAADIGEGSLRLEFTVYDTNIDLYWDLDGEVPKEYYSLTPAEAAEKTRVNQYGNRELTETHKGYAIVKKDGDTYKLLHYEIY